MIGRVINGVFGAGGAALLSQFPAFFAQYQQQLAGRLAQARADLSQVTEEAARLGLSPDEYLAKAEADGGEFTRVLVEGARATLHALDKLQAAYEAFSIATPLGRPVAFVQHFDPTIADSTMANFQPAVPLTIEGLIYAGTGLLLGVALLALLEWLGLLSLRATGLSRRPKTSGGLRAR
ncbi:Protein of unknown function [Tistlia consotensis]|uniref:DUF2937 family protein n=1 Tax=Tistlia consotensis USBA 355 TaxID=560819 RepID=A0A1Y6BER9_9PROT|nr:DUF2937 family protein [Tistlia consotensis]SMF00327.1 Protein of unknown function [Tistlia consotensis USBA 355]SNR75963.1 Protein of unknown function [Tistlia consotensis]